MDKFCEDCIHNEVCQYYAIPPHKDRCNDKDTLDDLIPQGEWIDVNGDGSLWKCNNCGEKSCCKGNYCPDCGAKMKGGAE